jgi:hypothetical protein
MGVIREYCKLYFANNGGQFTDTGLPIFQRGIRANCPKPFDCYDCNIMQRWLAELHADGWATSWECTECLKRSLPNEADRQVQGFFQSGRPSPGNGDPFDVDEDRPSLVCCPICGFQTSFLQLVLRRVR